MYGYTVYKFICRFGTFFSINIPLNHYKSLVKSLSVTIWLVVTGTWFLWLSIYIYIRIYIYIYWESSSQLTLTPSFSRGVEMAPPTRSEETWRPIFAGHRKTGALLGWVMFAMKTWLEAATKTWELYGNIWEIYGNIWESIGWSRGISWHLTMN